MKGAIQMRDKLLQVRVSEEEKNKINEIVQELKNNGSQPDIDTSSLVRQSLDKWYKTYMDIERGNSLVILQTSGFDTDDLRGMFADLKKIRDEAKEKGNEKLTFFYNSLINEMEFNISRILDTTKKMAMEELKKELQASKETVKRLKK